MSHERKSKRRREASPAPPAPRIIGGRFRGTKLLYSGDRRTRPMKERVREAVFNLLGTEVAGKYAVDLFAGTGALGLEALSRGGVGATFVEQHFPTAALLRQNIDAVGQSELCQVVTANVLIWVERELALPQEPWLVFCSPPYDFYVDRREAMLRLLTRIISAALPNSMIVVEADGRFDFGALPQAADWDVRAYPPAVIGILRKVPETSTA